MDGRRRQWQPISTALPWTKTGLALREKFGPMGLHVWVLVLLAAKRAPEQGVFVYVSESEGWALLGIEDAPPDFTLREFFDFTGRLKQTRRRRLNSGYRASEGRQEIVITQFEEWSQTARKELRAQKESRKRRRDRGHGMGHDRGTVGATDLDLDSDSERARTRAEIYEEPTPEQLAENARLAAELASALQGAVKAP